MSVRKQGFVVTAALAAASLCLAAPARAGLVVTHSAAGANAAAIQAGVDALRTALGANNGVGGAFPSGRREINWDGVPDSFAAPAALPANFFNSNSPRGAVFSGAPSFQVSANAGGTTPVEFGNLNPAYPGIFQVFSAQRLFAAPGAAAYDVEFFVPGTTRKAAVTSFGAVFADVDAGATCSSIEAFNGAISLGSFCAPAADDGLSFLAVAATGPDVITRVRLTAGNAALGPDDSDGAPTDVVAFDDFIYSEPQALADSEPVSQWVPIASKAAGKEGSQWRTDLGLVNRSAFTASVELRFRPSGGLATKTVTVEPGAQAILGDVVAQVGSSGSGSLEVRSAAVIGVTSRTFNEAAGGTFGQNYDAVAAGTGLAANQSALLGQLTENATFRCNIGIANTGATTATVDVLLLDGAGALLGTYTVTVPAGEVRQETQPFRAKAGQTALDRGYARVNVKSGSGVVAFASVIDNRTNDPTTVTALR